MDHLGLAMGAAFASGLNLYAAVAVLGLLERFGIAKLPATLEFLAHPVVLIVAIALYVIEFVADKVPYVDSIWDVVHTFIRPPAAALLAFSVMAGVPDAWRVVAALVAGGVALTSHGTKATVRAAANTSPEPFSNWALSLFEDGLAVFLIWFAVTYPLLTFVLVIVLMVVSIFILVKLVAVLRRVIRRAFGQKPVDSTAGIPPG